MDMHNMASYALQYCMHALIAVSYYHHHALQPEVNKTHQLLQCRTDPDLYRVYTFMVPYISIRWPLHPRKIKWRYRIVLVQFKLRPCLVSNFFWILIIFLFVFDKNYPTID